MPKHERRTVCQRCGATLIECDTTDGRKLRANATSVTVLVAHPEDGGRLTVYPVSLVRHSEVCPKRMRTRAEVVERERIREEARKLAERNPRGKRKPRKGMQ